MSELQCLGGGLVVEQSTPCDLRQLHLNQNSYITLSGIHAMTFTGAMGGESSPQEFITAWVVVKFGISDDGGMGICHFFNITITLQLHTI